MAVDGEGSLWIHEALASIFAVSILGEAGAMWKRKPLAVCAMGHDCIPAPVVRKFAGRQ